MTRNGTGTVPWAMYSRALPHYQCASISIQLNEIHWIDWTVGHVCTVAFVSKHQTLLSLGSFEKFFFPYSFSFLATSSTCVLLLHMLFSNLIGATLADAPIDTSSNGATLILLLADFEEEEEEGRETTKVSLFS
jgi:hypothetical protein